MCCYDEPNSSGLMKSMVVTRVMRKACSLNDEDDVKGSNEQNDEALVDTAGFCTALAAV